MQLRLLTQHLHWPNSSGSRRLSSWTATAHSEMNSMNYLCHLGCLTNTEDRDHLICWPLWKALESSYNPTRHLSWEFHQSCTLFAHPKFRQRFQKPDPRGSD